VAEAVAEGVDKSVKKGYKKRGKRDVHHNRSLKEVDSEQSIVEQMKGCGVGTCLYLLKLSILGGM
jgi:hypothetical protein